MASQYPASHPRRFLRVIISLIIHYLVGKPPEGLWDTWTRSRFFGHLARTVIAWNSSMSALACYRQSRNPVGFSVIDPTPNNLALSEFSRTLIADLVQAPAGTGYVVHAMVTASLIAASSKAHTMCTNFLAGILIPHSQPSNKKDSDTSYHSFLSHPPGFELRR